MPQEKRNNWITKKDKNGKETRYYRITKVVGHKLNAYGNEVPVRKEFTARTKKAAEAKVREYLEQQDKGITGNNRNFGIEADKWFRDYFMTSSRLKDSSKINYKRAWDNYMKSQAMYHYDLKNIDHSTIQSAYKTMVKAGVPYSSLELIHRVMKKLYAYFERAGYSVDCSRLVELPKGNSEIDDEDTEEVTVWSDEEIALILSSFDKADNRFRMRLFIFMAYYTGCRISELLGLKYSDIKDNQIRICRQLGDVIEEDSGKNDFTISKGLTKPKSKKSIRNIPLNSILQQEIELHRKWHTKEQGKGVEFIFTTMAGKPVDRKNVTRSLERYYEKIGIESKPVHTYRHTFGTNLCKSGVPIQVASELLGHDSIDTTMRYYINVSTGEKTDAVEKLIIK